ncbi:MAG: NACHT domain-containing protein [Symploca sp. SIO2E6]|nr:NACHT domain-containing protein [Symploca sp. SIO2E6]
MVEPWTALGVALLKDLVFKDVLLELGKGALEDYVKDFFKDCIKGVETCHGTSLLKKALGEALQQFLKIVEDELEFGCNLSGAEIRDGYEIAIEKFIRHQEVKPLLGQAFAKDCRVIDSKQLGKIWRQHYPQAMPTEFDWNGVAKEYVKEVKRIIKQSPELRAILELELQESIEKNTKEIAGISPDFNLKAYQEGLQERYANLNLDSLDTSVYDYREKLKVWQVFIAQNVRECKEFVPQVYEIPKEHQRRLRESNELEAEVDLEAWERYKEVYYEQPVRPILDVVNEIWQYDSHRYLVILGDPGSGKSIFLQYLALNWARSPLDNVIELPIPLLIELRTYNRDRNSGECQDLLEFFHKGNVICRLNQHQLQEKLKAGKVLVMFDGLDEVFEPTQREKVITDIHRFTNEYPKVRVIVTSRIIGYKHQRLRDAKFRHFLLQDLESEQIQDFIYRWHELTFTDEADKERKRERLQRAIDTSKAIGELAGNPLLLTMMAILNRNQELPRDRPELYNQASRVLLHQWDVERKLLADPRVDVVAIDYKDKQAILRQIAYFMQAADKGLAGNLIRGSDLERILTGYLKSVEVSNPRTIARLLIEQLRGRNFILCFLGGDSYGFVHRTFLEYFCASEFVERFSKRGIEGGLTLEELKTEVFGKHWQDESWHEVLRLIAGMIDTSFAGELIDYLMTLDGEEEKFINLFLAAECLSDVRNPAAIPSTAAKLLQQLYELMDYGSFLSVVRSDVDIEYNNTVTQIHTQAVAAVAVTWKDDPNTLPWLKQQVQAERNGTVRYAAVAEIARGWKNDPNTLPWLKQQVYLLKQQLQTNHFKIVRRAVVQEIARGWKDEPDTLPLLKQWAQADEDWVVRAAAVQELARGWKEEPETLVILKQRVQVDNHEYVRRVAICELARGWKNEPDSLTILKQRVQVDNHEYVRRVAICELARGWKNEPDSLAILKQRLQVDESATVRYAAVQQIARGWKDDPDTLPLLKQWVQADDSAAVRQAAVQELARGWKDDSKTLPLLKQKVHKDDDCDVRYAAVQELARGWKDEPDTLPLLKQRAQTDDYYDVRRLAIEELAHGWKDEAWMLEFLCNRVLNDPFERKEDSENNPRQLALAIIIKQYPNHPQTLPLLNDRAENDSDEQLREWARKKLVELTDGRGVLHTP